MTLAWLAGLPPAALIGLWLGYYLHLIPAPPPSVRSQDLGRGLYLLAYPLGILRLPYCILPYLAKVLLYLVWRERLWPGWHSYSGQAWRLGGDWLNWVVTSLGLIWLAKALGLPNLAYWLVLPAGAEYVRLLAEKLPMALSGLWQRLPHRRWARTAFCRRWLKAYCAYYALGDPARLDSVLRTLKTVEPEVAQKLAYFTGFRLVPDTLNLRAGRVRDVARGEIFIHLGWLNDPWLLKGLALRRTPWIFDPRWLRRPFYYRTEANPLVTCFVLRHWKYCPPYAWYQFGHQIKAARYTLFYELCRGLGRNLETPVLCDGAVEPEPLLHFWFKLGRARRPLWSETEVRQAVTDMPVEVSSEEIAVRFTLPLLYVKEVLRPRLE